MSLAVAAMTCMVWDIVINFSDEVLGIATIVSRMIGATLAL